MSILERDDALALAALGLTAAFSCQALPTALNLIATSA
jgi:hypothetical protein